MNDVIIVNALTFLCFTHIFHFSSRKLRVKVNCFIIKSSFCISDCYLFFTKSSYQKLLFLNTALVCKLLAERSGSLRQYWAWHVGVFIQDVRVRLTPRRFIRAAYSALAHSTTAAAVEWIVGRMGSRIECIASCVSTGNNGMLKWDGVLYHRQASITSYPVSTSYTAPFVFIVALVYSSWLENPHLTTDHVLDWYISQIRPQI